MARMVPISWDLRVLEGSLRAAVGVVIRAWRKCTSFLYRLGHRL